MIKTIAITMGDPTGIGYEIVLKSLSHLPVFKKNQFVVIGALPFVGNNPLFQKLKKQKHISFLDVGLSEKSISEIRAVKTTKNNKIRKAAGQCAFLSLQKALVLLKEKKAQALVTAPISKENIQQAGFVFPGHTEYLCHEFRVKNHGMMLFNNFFRIVLTTIHIPLHDVSSTITRPLVYQKLELLHTSLKQVFHISKPKIAVCGLNPHAGEKGLFGNEEKTAITPAINKFLKKHPGAFVQGPLPADTVFQKAATGFFDAILCHYHDQGLIPVKLMGEGGCVNLTLGLPFVRTSPGHGTAEDIAGKNKANPASMLAAITAAINLSCVT